VTFYGRRTRLSRAIVRSFPACCACTASGQLATEFPRWSMLACHVANVFLAACQPARPVGRADLRLRRAHLPLIKAVYDLLTVNGNWAL
jgi:hypothetical protein